MRLYSLKTNLFAECSIRQESFRRTSMTFKGKFVSKEIGHVSDTGIHAVELIQSTVKQTNSKFIVDSHDDERNGQTNVVDDSYHGVVVVNVLEKRHA